MKRARRQPIVLAVGPTGIANLPYNAAEWLHPWWGITSPWQLAPADTWSVYRCDHQDRAAQWVDSYNAADYRGGK
jgi:hypothetical protein